MPQQEDNFEIEDKVDQNNSTAAADVGEEGESVYMIDGVVMRMIQIEGEEQQYLMDP